MGVLAGMDLEVSLGFKSCGCSALLLPQLGMGNDFSKGWRQPVVVIGCIRWLQMQGFSSLAHPTPLCK